MAIGKYKEWLEEEKLILLEGWARDGLIDEQIAHNIGINVGTLYDWKKKYIEISNALKKGKEVADYEVESALFRRALGYDVEEVVTEITDGKKHIKKTKKHIPADVTAQIYWLKNRRPDKWRDKPVNTAVEEVEPDGFEEMMKNAQCTLVDDSEMLNND